MLLAHQLRTPRARMHDAACLDAVTHEPRCVRTPPCPRTQLFPLPPPAAAAKGVNATAVPAAESVAVKEAVEEEEEVRGEGARGQPLGASQLGSCTAHCCLILRALHTLVALPCLPVVLLSPPFLPPIPLSPLPSPLPGPCPPLPWRERR